jgi:outer membrane protein
MHRSKIVIPALAAVLQLAAQAPKIAVINSQTALVTVQQGKQALEQFKARYDAKKKEFDTRENEIVQLEDQLNKSGAVMSDDKRGQLAAAISDKKKRYQRDMQDTQEAADRDQQLIVQPLEERLNLVIGKYAADNGYTLVVDIGLPGNQIRYAAPSVDITKDIVILYDKTYPFGIK